MTTRTSTRTVDESAPKATMGEFTHLNPNTGEAFGDRMVFDRGPAVAADGGRADARRDDDGETMEDVDHEHPHEDAEDANRVFARGQSDDGDGEDDDEEDERNARGSDDPDARSDGGRAGSV